MRIRIVLTAVLLLPASARGQIFVGGEFRVNAQTTGTQGNPAVSMDPNGTFVVVWEDRRNGQYEIYGRRFFADGTISAEFQVNVVAGTHTYPVVSTEASGNFVVAWQDEDVSDGDLFGRRFTFPFGTVPFQFEINSYITSAQFEPAAARGEPATGW